MNNDKIEPGEVKGPTGLLAGKLLFLCEINEVAMVGLDFNWDWMFFQVVAKMFKG